MGRGGCGSDTRSNALAKYSRAEVAKHATVDDCWIIHKAKVYDVSRWAEHPGGGIIFGHGGYDVTDVFAAFHGPEAHKTLKTYLIGTVREEDAQETDFEKAYRKLRVQLMQAGLYKVNHFYYAYKVSFNLAMLAGAVAVLHYFAADYPLLAPVVSGWIVALFYQQCGWLAHDYLHNQVFPHSFSTGKLWGLFIGNVLQGFDVTWWMTKHNGHHAQPNVLNVNADGGRAKAHVGDGDIDTAPFLSWSKNHARTATQSPLGRFFLKYQAALYFPILLIARLSWLVQSAQTAFGIDGGWNSEDTTGTKRANNTLAVAGLVLHYLGNLWIIFSYLSPAGAALWLFCSQCGCGLLLALVFGLGHNGCAVYDADAQPDFWQLQVTTTRNVEPSWFNNWFCGGLQYQIEHHLMPMIPRHNLGKVAEIVKPFCEEHNVPYHCTGLFEGTKEVLAHLGHVSKEMMEEFPGL